MATTLKVSKQIQQPTSFLESEKVEINNTECVSILNILEAMQTGNASLPPTAAKFVAKNTKKLRAFNSKILQEAKDIDEQYYQKDKDGNILYWNGVEEPKEGGEVKEGARVPVRAYLDVKKNTLFYAGTENALEQEVAKTLRVQFESVEKMLEFQTKKTELAKRKSECHIIKVTEQYLNDNKIALPSRIANYQSGEWMPADLTALFDYLIVDNDKPEINGSIN